MYPTQLFLLRSTRNPSVGPSLRISSTSNWTLHRGTSLSRFEPSHPPPCKVHLPCRRVRRLLSSLDRIDFLTFFCSYRLTPLPPHPVLLRLLYQSWDNLFRNIRLILGPKKSLTIQVVVQTLLRKDFQDEFFNLFEFQLLNKIKFLFLHSQENYS